LIAIIGFELVDRILVHHLYSVDLDLNVFRSLVIFGSDFLEVIELLDIFEDSYQNSEQHFYMLELVVVEQFIYEMDGLV